MEENNQNKEPLNKDFKVPKLRFSEFANSWNEKLFSDFVVLSTEKVCLSKLKDSSVPDIELDSVESSTGKLLKTYSSNTFQTAKSRFHKGDVLYSKLRPYLRKHILAKFDGVASTEFWVLSPKSNITSSFLLYLVESEKFNLEANKACGTKMPRADWDIVSKVNFCIPSSNKEQEKISSLLSKIDEKLNLLSSKITALKKYRKGLLKIVCEKGHVCLLGEVLKEEIHKTKVNNEYPIISSTSEGVFLQKDYFNHQVASDNNVGYKIIRKNQIVFSPQNLWLGNINLNDKYDVGCVSPSYKIYSFDTAFIEPQFLIEYLKTSYMLYQYKLCSEQGASVVRRNLDLSSFLELKITLPNLEKQKIIGTLKTHLDLLDRQFFLLRQIKSFLLQNMFI